MMFSTDSFGWRTRRAAKAPSAPADPATDERSETERRLARELEQVMAGEEPRLSSAAPPPIPTPVESEIVVPTRILTERRVRRMKTDGYRAARTRRDSSDWSDADPLDGLTADETAGEIEVSSSARPPQAAQWVKKARRDVWRTRLRNAMAWCVTVLVATGLTALAAYFLFGARFELVSLLSLSKAAVF